MSARSLAKGLVYTLGLAIWVVFSLVLGQTLAGIAFLALPINLTASVENVILAGSSYVLALAIAIGVPWALTKKKPGLKTLGIQRVLSWSDIGLSILAVLPYFILSALVIYIGTEVFTVIDPDVGQQLGFDAPSMRIEYLLAFLVLVVFAPLGEELLFRGYFLGKLSERVSKWLAVFVTALVFGLLHLPGFTESGVVLQWGAAADTFAMGLTAGVLRMLSGSIWAGVLLHAIKNGIAFYFLFINPLPPGSM